MRGRSIPLRPGLAPPPFLLTPALMGPAAALGAFSSPVTISRPHTFIDRLSTLTLGGGAQVASWLFQDGTGQNAPGGGRFVVRNPGGAYGSEHTLPSGFLELAGHGQARLPPPGPAPRHARDAV